MSESSAKMVSKTIFPDMVRALFQAYVEKAESVKMNGMIVDATSYDIDKDGYAEVRLYLKEGKDAK